MKCNNILSVALICVTLVGNSFGQTSPLLINSLLPSYGVNGLYGQNKLYSSLYGLFGTNVLSAFTTCYSNPCNNGGTCLNYGYGVFQCLCTSTV